MQVTEHVFIARTCPVCRRRRVPTAQLDGVALGRQRLGVNLISRIATLREEGRLPIRSIQWYLRTVHQLRRSVGAIVSAIHQTAQQAQVAVAAMVDRIRASPVVHADETGPTKPGRRNRLARGRRQWLRVDFQHSHRALLPAAGSGQGGGGRSAGRGVLRSAGQRLLRRLPPLRWPQATVLGPPLFKPGAGSVRDIHDLVALYPKDTSLAQWAAAVHQPYVGAGSMSRPGLSPICQGRRKTVPLGLSTSSERVLLTNWRSSRNFAPFPVALDQALAVGPDAHLLSCPRPHCGPSTPPSSSGIHGSPAFPLPDYSRNTGVAGLCGPLRTSDDAAGETRSPGKHPAAPRISPSAPHLGPAAVRSSLAPANRSFLIDFHLLQVLLEQCHVHGMVGLPVYAAAATDPGNQLRRRLAVTLRTTDRLVPG